MKGFKLEVLVLVQVFTIDINFCFEIVHLSVDFEHFAHLKNMMISCHTAFYKTQ